MRRNSIQPEMNVTPLVDVVLVLLIIFMVIAPRVEAGAEVELPTAIHVDPKRRADFEPVTVSVARDGALFLEREPMARAELEAALARLRAAEPRRPMVLKGDRAAPYRVVRERFAHAKSLGFPGLSLQVGEDGGASSSSVHSVEEGERHGLSDR